MKRLLVACAAAGAIALGGCAGVQKALDDYTATVVKINAAIGASAPLVAQGCQDLQAFAVLIQPFLPTSAKAPKYFAAANGALGAYCQTVPNDVNGTARAVAAALAAAKSGYYSVSGGQ